MTLVSGLWLAACASRAHSRSHHGGDKCGEQVDTSQGTMMTQMILTYEDIEINQECHTINFPKMENTSILVCPLTNVESLDLVRSIFGLGQSVKCLQIANMAPVKNILPFSKNPESVTNEPFLASLVLDLACLLRPTVCAILWIKALQSLYCFARARETRRPAPTLTPGWQMTPDDPTNLTWLFIGSHLS